MYFVLVFRSESLRLARCPVPALIRIIWLPAAAAAPFLIATSICFLFAQRHWIANTHTYAPTLAHSIPNRAFSWLFSRLFFTFVGLLIYRDFYIKSDSHPICWRRFVTVIISAKLWAALQSLTKYYCLHKKVLQFIDKCIQCKDSRLCKLVQWQFHKTGKLLQLKYSTIFWFTKFN